MAITEVNFLQSMHTATKRDYLARMNAEKPVCMRVAKQYGKDYWDGDRKYGYGGYHHDGRWKPVAEMMIKHYELKAGSNVWDIGCGKAHLIYEMAQLGMQVGGCDISDYAERNSKELVFCTSSTNPPWKKGTGDLVISINLLHNLSYKNLKRSIKKLVSVSRDKRYICVESYRTEEELCNLQCWALTCQSFYSPDDWKGILEDNGYSGDVEFIYFS